MMTDPVNSPACSQKSGYSVRCQTGGRWSIIQVLRMVQHQEATNLLPLPPLLFFITLKRDQTVHIFSSPACSALIQLSLAVVTKHAASEVWSRKVFCDVSYVKPGFPLLSPAGTWPAPSYALNSSHPYKSDTNSTFAEPLDRPWSLSNFCMPFL